MHFLCKASSHRNSQVSKDDSCRIARNQIVKSGSLVCCGLSVVVRGGCRAENQLKMIAKIIDTAMPISSSPSDEVIGEHSLSLPLIFLV